MRLYEMTPDDEWGPEQERASIACERSAAYFERTRIKLKPEPHVMDVVELTSGKVSFRLTKGFMLLNYWER